MAKAAATQPFLVEIGTEELPPKNLKGLAIAFHQNLILQLTDNLLWPNNPSEGETFFSPRRLAVHLPGILIKQKDRNEERLGPAVAAAFDKVGKPTPAAEGFARSCGVTISQLEHRATDKGERLIYTRKIKGKTAAELLPQIVNEALAKLPISKRMRWGAGDTEFVRPVHWVVMLLGEKPLTTQILGVKAGNKTYGHRFLHPAAITLKHPRDYREALAKTGKVLVEDRTGTLANRIIRAMVNQTAERVHGRAQVDETLLEEVAALVEWPVPITGSFDQKFLALPDEVIVAVLKTQQRYFPMRDAKGKLLPKFVAISNIQSKKPAEVQCGNERVIVPRLTDAMFFWDSDRKTRLEAHLPELERITFQKGLGSLADKSRRVAKLAEQIAGQINGDPGLTNRAGLLCKCDLVTGMVGEFPELQGVMGGHYAHHDHEPEAIAAAISEHYRPRHAGDDLPKTLIGKVLAIADKLDTLTGIFALGQKPSGDKDPFGLRRAGLGVMRILVEQQLDLDLTQLLRAALAGQQRGQNQEALVDELYEFLLERLWGYYLETGIRADVFAAVRARRPPRPLDFQRRIQAVNTFLTSPEAVSLASANKRIANILKQGGGVNTREVEWSLLHEPAEKSLLAHIERLQQDIRPLLASGDYTATLKKLAALRAPVDEFFNQVLVMDPDAKIRANRLALLGRLSDLFLHIADLALIQTE